MRVLYVANLIPYPKDNGGKIFTYSTIKSLSENHEVDLVCFYEHEDEFVARNALSAYCKNITMLPIRVTTRENISLMIRKAFRSLFSLKPLAVSKYYTREMELEIKKIIAENNYDYVFFNLLAMCIYLDGIIDSFPNIRTVLYEQNCEAIIYKGHYNSTCNPIKKFFLFLEYIKLNKFEQEMVSKVDKLILLSANDKMNLNIKDRNVSIIPIGVENPNRLHDYHNCNSSNKIRLLFVGTLTWKPNLDGIVWFLENVMPLCKSEEYELTIVGKYTGCELSTLANAYSNVNLLGYVDDIEDIYDKSDVLLVPLFVGSGQRVKIIEAYSRGFAVITTDIGVSGLLYEDEKTVLIANTAEEFKHRIDQCLARDCLVKLGKNAKEYFDKYYSVEVISKKLNDALVM